MGMSSGREYVSLAVAAKTLGVSEVQIKRYAQRRLIGVQTLPDLPARYCRADLEAMKARCTTPADETALAVAS